MTNRARVHGAIPRVQAQRAHRAFLDAARPDHALVEIRTARSLVDNGETASSYLGEEATTLVTTTIPDEALDQLTLDQELAIITEFEPDFYLPADEPTYTLDEREKRVRNIRECMAGTHWMRDHLADQDVNTEVIPLLKGVTPGERAICYEMFEAFDAPQCGFYVGQYFTGGEGVLVDKVVADLHTIDRELDTAGQDQELLVIGLLAPQTLKRVPNRVTAAAGLNTWLTDVDPRSQSAAVVNERHERVAELVEAALTTTPDASDALDDGTANQPQTGR